MAVTLERPDAPQMPQFVCAFCDPAYQGYFPYRDIQHLREDREDMEISIHLNDSMSQSEKTAAYDAVRGAYFQYKQNYKIVNEG